MKTQFTPGPWKCKRAPKIQHAIDRKWEIVADCNGGGQMVVVGEHTGIDCLKEPDARLIAAAPELMEALAAMVALVRDDSKSPRRISACMAAASAAIAKAQP